jgi:predicted nuclease of predicted toxin-antitoxin system
VCVSSTCPGPREAQAGRESWGARTWVARGCGSRRVDRGDAGLSQSPDELLIARCRGEGRALVTLDTDFANAMRYPPAKYEGIIVVRTSPRATASDIEAALSAFLDAVADSPISGRLLVVDPGGRVREYRPAEG